MALMLFFGCLYVLAAEYVKMYPPRSDVLLFQRGHVPPHTRGEDEEAVPTSKIADTKSQGPALAIGTDVLGSTQGANLVWSGLTYEIKVDKKEKLILNHIDGWVKPNTLTALMVRATIPGKRRSSQNIRDHLEPARLAC